MTGPPDVAVRVAGDQHTSHTCQLLRQRLNTRILADERWAATASFANVLRTYRKNLDLSDEGNAIV